MGSEIKLVTSKGIITYSVYDFINEIGKRPVSREIIIYFVLTLTLFLKYNLQYGVAICSQLKKS